MIESSGLPFERNEEELSVLDRLFFSAISRRLRNQSCPGIAAIGVCLLPNLNLGCLCVMVPVRIVPHAPLFVFVCNGL
jgi:hypothetical protein